MLQDKRDVLGLKGSTAITQIGVTIGQIVQTTTNNDFRQMVAHDNRVFLLPIAFVFFEIFQEVSQSEKFQKVEHSSDDKL